SIHAPEGQRGEEPPWNPQDAVIDVETAAIEVETLPEEVTEPTQPTQLKRGPGRPKGSRTSLEHRLTQFINEVTTVNEAGNTSGPDDEGELDPESPEYRKLVILKYTQRQAIPIGSSPPLFPTDAPTIEDPND
ncbi:hypothetical protein PENANT_c348G00447, partial [Penicillium antarcticum]